MAYVINRLNACDLPEIERHLLNLDLMARYTRFGSAFPDTWVSAYVHRIDLSRALLIGAIDGSAGCIVGLAEAQPTQSPGRVEIAVSVHAPYRRNGIGRSLVTEAMNGAFSNGAETAECLFARDNRPIIGLIRALGGRFVGTLGSAEFSSTAFGTLTHAA